MRFENIYLESLDTNLGCGQYVGNYIIPATDELIGITNKIRERQGNTDLVGIDYENDVYYTYYLYFNAEKKKITLQAEVSHGEKDDYMCYTIKLLPKEKEMLMWKIIRELLVDIEN